MSPRRWLGALALWLALAVALWLPVTLAAPAAGRFDGAAGVVALVLLLAGLHGLVRGRLLWWPIAVVAAGLVWVRLVHFGLVQFSGAGFAEEFFIHFEWQSVAVAWHEYRMLVVGGIVVVGVLLAGLLLAGRRVAALPYRAAAVALVLGLAMLPLARHGMPEWDLWQSWQRWSQPVFAEIDHDALQRFERLGLIDGAVLPKYRVSARAPKQPRNLILVYLESVGVNLAGRSDWPELMPTFTRLMDEHAWVDYLWSSSYITIEGLSNTLCGTLFPFRRESDSLAEGDHLAEWLPCLPDVLKRAGYHQVYLGGAGMSFAGKGDFLAAHGYDELKGLEYWREQGLEQRPGKWGLSDAELFDLSIEEIRRLREGEAPFNLTLLTIGTHLPGYHYRECDRYRHGDDRFLDALHCTDQLLAGWLERLHEEDLLENTVLVITADHHVFPNPDMQALFGEDVHDRRLPLIVIGEELPPPAARVGAGYDLAPTVLELLDIKHDAGFLLGRSLLAGNDRPDYHVKRHRDIHQGRAVSNGDIPCDDSTGNLPALPLSRCDRAELAGLLESMKLALSYRRSRIQCGDDQLNRVRVPVDPDEPVEVVIGGEDQRERFTFHSRRVAMPASGLFVLALDEDGMVGAREFVPMARLDQPDKIDALVGATAGHHRLVIWRPDSAGIANADLAALGVPELPPRIQAWLIDRQGKSIARSQAGEDGQADVLDLDAVFCR